MPVGRESIDRIFDTASNVIDAGKNVYGAIDNAFQKGTDSRRYYDQQQYNGRPPMYQNVQYGYGYADNNYMNGGGYNFGFAGELRPVQGGYPGFANQAYGSGGMY